jgi:hypothetical protein
VALKSRFFRARYIRFVTQTLFWAPLMVAVAAAMLLAAVPQMSEVYLGIIEETDIARGTAGLATIALFCAFLYAWNHGRALCRIDAIYPEHADIYFDRDILKIRDLKAGAVAILPIVGLLIGMIVLNGRVQFAYANIKMALQALNDTTPRHADLAAALSRLPVAMLCATALVLVVGIALIWMLHILRDNSLVRKGVLSVCYAVAGAALTVPIAAPDATLALAHRIGPLAGCGIVLITLAVLAQLLAYVVRLIATAVLSIIATALMSLTALPSSMKHTIGTGIVGVALAVLLVLMAAREPKQEQERPGTAPELANPGPGIGKHFADWLDQRQDKARYPGKYPVFIVAAQGGGIYATSAAASFLASLQDRCPQFAQHVFAISAVSGGAIGSSIFDAMMQGVPQTDQACSDIGATPLADRVSQIILGDHLTPVLLELVPDTLTQPLAALFGEAAGLKDWAVNRAGMLERSFTQSFNGTKAAVRSAGLATPFSKHWSTSGAAPALLLNATWVETGYRVALSPFPLRSASDGTLYSLAELKDIEDRSLQNMSLIESGSVSARFPLVLPSWTAYVKNKRTLFDRWTFVDGGYADGSGATTALDVFKTISETARAKNTEVYMILLTNVSADPEFSKIGSNWFDDYVSPVRTILRVRDLLGWRAVTQTKSQLGDKVIELQLEHRAFPLPLGWKISRASNNLIEFMAGTSNGCHELKTGARLGTGGADLAIKTVHDNSCQLQRLISLLSAK